MRAWALLFASAALASFAGSDRLDTPLAEAGDATRGRETFLSREGGHCILCHAAPGVTTAGDIGPSMAGIGSRLDAAQIRLRIVDITRVKPEAAMPSFHRTGNLQRVAAAYQAKPALTAQQVEDLVAWLGTLK